MMNGNLSHQQALTAWQALRDWLVQDEAGQAVLARFQADPHGQASALTQWLQARSGQVPLQLATYVLGGQVEKLINIAQAGVVLFQLILPLAPPRSLYQLPPDIGDFTGRRKALAKVTALLEQAARAEGTAVVISAVAGMAGVGKSALAIHVAHRVKDRFPDAQLYVNLRGAEGQPRNPFDVLSGFLRALGVEDGFIPKDPEGRVSLYRSRLVEKQALVLLDNAHDEAQVRPLLPGSTTCAVLVTSRKRLSALEGTAVLDLAVMTEREALALLRRLIGRKRVRAEPRAAKQIIVLCGQLPLTIRIAGGKLRDKPHWSLEDYASQLANERQRLERLQLGDLGVRASFGLSYQDLGSNDARLFRLLGLLAGPDFMPEAVAVLLDTDPEAAQDGVERLVDAQLLEPSREGRYRFHDLMHLFAREQLEQEEPPPQQQAACLRASRWYFEVSGAMNRQLQPETRRQEAQALATQTGQSLVQVEQNLLLRSLAWFDSERENLLTAVEWAHKAEAWEVVWQLAANMVGYFDIRSLFVHWRWTHILALEATRKAGERSAEGQTLNNLGRVCRRQGRWDEAIETYEEALGIFRELEDSHGEAQALRGLGEVYSSQGRRAEVIEMYEESLRIFRALGDRHGEGRALANLGTVYRRQSRWAEAIMMFEESLRIRRTLEDRYGEAYMLANLGTVYRHQSRWAKAIEMYDESLRIKRELGDRLGEANTLANLGTVYRYQGRWAEAIEMYEKSLRIKRELGARYGEGRTLANLGTVYRRQGRCAEAIEKYKESLRIKRELGDRHGEGRTLANLGTVYRHQGRWAEAIEMYEKSLRMKRELGDRLGEARTLASLGTVYRHQRRWAEAIEKYEESLRIKRELGDRHGEGLTLRSMGLLCEEQSQREKAIALWQEALTKLNPDSPEHKQVRKWLQSAD